LRYAGAIATWYEAVLQVLHVMPDPTASWASAVSATPAEIVTQMRAAAHAALHDFVDEADVSAPLAGEFVRSGPPTAEILEYATDMKPDLIVMGTHGRSGLNHILMGSTAERVVS
jgi:nucleotide-binding universal stress UspA family protein